MEDLSVATEAELRDLGFGYRARYIVDTTKKLRERGDDWLSTLRDKPREEVSSQLQTLPGIGPKVSDCIALFSLDKLDLVPVDTHVWQISKRFMTKPNLLSTANPNPKLYSIIYDFFISRFGPKAGWAHTILFTAELAHFQEVLTGDSLTPESSHSASATNKSKGSKKRSTPTTNTLENPNSEEEEYAPKKKKFKKS